MSVSYIPEHVKCRLWGKAAGLCEYAGCNHRLYLDALTKAEFNAAYIAHIIADKPRGPRGDPVLSHKLKADISNLMLMCDQHHRLIDKVDVEGHPVHRLRDMKALHERRIQNVTNIDADKESHVLLYGANVGEHASPLTYEKAREAMAPEWFPADTAPITLGMFNSVLRDGSSNFWRVETNQLRAKFCQEVRSRLDSGGIRHLSVFAFAPPPLLMLLGYLLSDIPAAEVYQLHREPQDWKWQGHPEDWGYIVQRPDDGVTGQPALVLALSATITDDRIAAVLGEDTPIWRVTVPEPHNDFLKSRKQLRQFREAIRLLMDEIKARHGEDVLLHVFPAAPVAIAVEMGRVIMPKADLRLSVYDQNRSRGGFVHALDLPPTRGDQK